MIVVPLQILLIVQEGFICCLYDPKLPTPSISASVYVSFRVLIYLLILIQDGGRRKVFDGFSFEEHLDRRQSPNSLNVEGRRETDHGCSAEEGRMREHPRSSREENFSMVELDRRG